MPSLSQRLIFSFLPLQHDISSGMGLGARVVKKVEWTLETHRKYTRRLFERRRDYL